MIFTDAHTHLYDCHDLDTAVFWAFHNIGKLTASSGEIIRTAVIFLTETPEQNYFRIFEQEGQKYQGSPLSEKSWVVRNTRESSSLRVEHRDYQESELYLVAGRQLVTEEKLEVLALGCTAVLPCHMPLGQTVELIAENGGITVLPWGVGKWIGRRGTVLEQFLRGKTPALLFLGDNGSRPAVWPSPLLQNAHARGLKVLSGSDPLPLAGEEKRICSFGSFIHADLIPDRPAESVKTALSAPGTRVSHFGKPQPLHVFIKKQISLRLSSS